MSFILFQDDSLWACLAGMAASHKELSTAEIAYAAIEEVRIILVSTSLDSLPFEAGITRTSFLGVHKKYWPNFKRKSN